MAKYTKKEIVKFAKEFNKTMDLGNPISVKGDQAAIAKAIKDEVDALYISDEKTLSKEAWGYATKILKLVPEDAGEPEAPAKPKETAAQKKARIKAEKASAKTTGKTDTKKDKKTTAPKRDTAARTEFISEQIAKGKFTRKEIVERCSKKFPDAPASTFGTIVTDAKNPKYCRFAKLAVQDSEGIYKFGTKNNPRFKK